MARSGAAGVRHPAGSVSHERAAAAMGVSAGAVALVAWAWVRPDPPSAWWLLAAAVAVLAAWSWWSRRHVCWGEIAWGNPGRDPPPEAGWRWISAARPRGVALTDVRGVLDLGHALLMAARTPDGLTLWLWCRADAGEPAEWLALRRTLTAHGEGPGRSGIFGRSVPTHDG